MADEQNQEEQQRGKLDQSVPKKKPFTPESLDRPVIEREFAESSRIERNRGIAITDSIDCDEPGLLPERPRPTAQIGYSLDPSRKADIQND